MLLLEQAAERDKHPEIQVFGSDLDQRALGIAREGCYPTAIEADVSDERLRRFFTRDGDHYRVKRELRDCVLIANHSLLKDPPFSRLDLVSCRNLLIYLQRDLQKQVLSSLHYGLKSEGYLFLGSSESADQPAGLFSTVDREARLYRSTGRRAEALLHLPRMVGDGPANRTPAASPPRAGARETRTAHAEALEQWAPASLLVDESFQVVRLSETAGRYLQPSAGPITLDVSDLLRPELRFEVRGALHRAFEREEATLMRPSPSQLSMALAR